MVLHPPLKLGSLGRVERAALSAISYRAREIERESCYVGEREVWYSASTSLPRCYPETHTSPCHFIKIIYIYIYIYTYVSQDVSNYNISALRAAVADGIRDWLVCTQPGQAVLLSWIGDKPTPLRAIRSWPLLPLSLATHTHTLSRSLHDNKAAVPR